MGIFDVNEEKLKALYHREDTKCQILEKFNVRNILILTRQKSEEKLFENSNYICIRASWKYEEAPG